MLYTDIFSCFFALLAIIGVLPINWAVIVTGSLGLISLVILFSFYFKINILELKKYFILK